MRWQKDWNMPPGAEKELMERWRQDELHEKAEELAQDKWDRNEERGEMISKSKEYIEWDEDTTFVKHVVQGYALYLIDDMCNNCGDFRPCKCDYKANQL